MDIKNNIDRGVYLEAQSVAEFSQGGWTPNYKTKRSRTKWFKKTFNSKDKLNFMPDELILFN